MLTATVRTRREVRIRKRVKRYVTVVTAKVQDGATVDTADAMARVGWLAKRTGV